MRLSLVLTLALGFVVAAAVAPLAEEASPSEKATGDAYPLDTCPISGQKLGAMGDPVVRRHDGREVRFCCQGCVPKFEKDPAAAFEKIDAAIVKQQKKAYPLDVCPVSGKEIGSGGMTPKDVVIGNRLVRLCCGGCAKKAAKNAKATIAKIDRAVVEKQKKSYPLKTCVISGKPLDEKAVDFVHANRLVRLCCPGCVAKVKKNPAAALAKIDAAAKKD